MQMQMLPQIQTPRPPQTRPEQFKFKNSAPQPERQEAIEDRYVSYLPKAVAIYQLRERTLPDGSFELRSKPLPVQQKKL